MAAALPGFIPKFMETVLPVQTGRLRLKSPAVFLASSKWLGTVWAPNGAINIGPSLCKTDITGALWSATRVTIDCNIALVFAPFQENENTSIFPYYPPPANGKTNELLGAELSSLAEQSRH